jgi:hypothetical protein
MVPPDSAGVSPKCRLRPPRSYATVSQNYCRTMHRVTVGKAARENGISRRTLQRWVRDGVIDRAPDGTVDPHEVAFRVGRRQSSDRRRGPKPGMGQGQLQLGKTRTGRRLSDIQRADIIFRHLKNIDDPIIFGFVLDRAQNQFRERMGIMASATAKMAESLQAKAQQPTSSAPSPSVAVPASAPAQ